jgi:hypothetical protein
MHVIQDVMHHDSVFLDALSHMGQIPEDKHDRLKKVQNNKH